MDGDGRASRGAIWGAGGAARAVALSGPGGGGVGSRERDDAGGGAEVSGNEGGEGADAASTLAVCWEGGGVSVCPLFFPR